MRQVWLGTVELASSRPAITAREAGTNAPETREVSGLGFGTESWVVDICRTLEAEYGNPRHGNKRNPLDELIFVILSTRTRDNVYRESYGKLRRAFPSWNEITPNSLPMIEAILRPAGLGRLKAQQIVAILEALRERFGRATLAPLRRMNDAEAEAFLTSLPGVGRKVAKCVLMYSLERQVLPVDVHVHRIAARLGFQVKRRADTSQDLIELAVPPDLRYGFHVNSVAHGRAVCLPRRPRCDRCCLSRYCRFYHSVPKGI